MIEGVDPAAPESACGDFLGPEALVRRGAADGVTVGFQRLQFVLDK